jgi:hypothetical protein
VAGAGSVAVVLLVLAAGFTAQTWFDGWSYEAADTAIRAIEDDPAGAQSIGRALVDQVPSGTCTPAAHLDLGILAGTAEWVRVCGDGGAAPTQRGVRLYGPRDEPELRYAVDGSPSWLGHSCLRHVDGGWLSMFGLHGSGHDNCADGYTFEGGA